MSQKQNILLLVHHYPNIANTVLDHIKGIEKFSEHSITTLNTFTTPSLPEDFPLEKFDCIIIHYTIVISHERFLNLPLKKRIHDFQGLKMLMIQDEHRWINAINMNAHYMGIEAIFSVVPPNVQRDIYLKNILPNVHIDTVLTGYVPEDLINEDVPEYEERSVDVSYRARKVSPALGHFSQQKWIIADKFIQSTKHSSLKLDISTAESNRLYGDAWINLLKNSKAVLGTESGVSLCDFTGKIQTAVDEYLLVHPQASFEEVEKLYFKGLDYNVLINVISPRCFEAAALRTLLILYPGEYSGILKPWRHYVPLEADHSNIEDVIATLKNKDKVKEITENAYNEIVLNKKYHFSSMVKTIDDAINQLSKKNKETASHQIGETALSEDQNLKINQKNTKRSIKGHLFDIMQFIFVRTTLANQHRIRKVYNWSMKMRVLLLNTQISKSTAFWLIKKCISGQFNWLRLFWLSQTLKSLSFLDCVTIRYFREHEASDCIKCVLTYSDFLYDARFGKKCDDATIKNIFASDNSINIEFHVDHYLSSLLYTLNLDDTDCIRMQSLKIKGLSKVEVEIINSFILENQDFSLINRAA